ncbi:unnamed protein product [Vitrella brassicaformis CCMP3155]|uniref:Reverse transcriptase Ty1/copia-type domain-containing protein n=1 Tax=Vitrella brassicaformis (strain CCMP3155) TaxID=1169540 RepID=A0A0G4GWN4_VITBC|nr:unnamed protein product [Vitrella brassicaformis CCMP3155]|eukprot:CEM35173.1 unnamed protein product [Vitrella brassicaformis CCMP3155]
MSGRDADADWFRELLNREYGIKDLGKADVFVGIKIERDPLTGEMKLSQRAYIEKILKRFRWEHCNPASTPVASGVKLSKDHCPSTPEEKEWSASMQAVYRQAVGTLLYLARAKLITDNRGAGSVSYSEEVKQRTRQILVRYHFVRDLVLKGQLCVHWSASSENTADIFTKGPDEAQHAHLRMKLLNNPVFDDEGSPMVPDEPHDKVLMAPDRCERNLRRNNMRNLVVRILAEADVPSNIEASLHSLGITPPDDNPNSQRMDIYCVIDGHDYLLDVTITHPCRPDDSAHPVPPDGEPAR